MPPSFREPGSDGALDPSINIWKKGIVYTHRPPPAGVIPGYRIFVSFKRGVSPDRPVESFRDLYSRVLSIGAQRVKELAQANESLSDEAATVCHGWMLLGEGGKMATAYILLELQARGKKDESPCGARTPTDEELSIPGGTDPVALMEARPQASAEVFNEFDFSDSSDDVVTVSFGESIATDPGDAFEFTGSVERAELFAQRYQSFLTSWGEVEAPRGVVRREWFLADARFATVHVCLGRHAKRINCG